MGRYVVCGRDVNEPELIRTEAGGEPVPARPQLWHFVQAFSHQLALVRTYLMRSHSSPASNIRPHLARLITDRSSRYPAERCRGVDQSLRNGSVLPLSDATAVLTLG